jgi:hypothetical protein
LSTKSRYKKLKSNFISATKGRWLTVSVPVPIFKKENLKLLTSVIDPDPDHLAVLDLDPDPY